MSFAHLKFTPKIDADLVKNLQADVDQWIGLMNDDQSDNQCLSDTTNRILLAVSGQIVEGSRLSKLMAALNTVQKLSNFSITSWKSDGKEQTPQKSSLGDLLKKTLVDNFHSVRDECQAFDKKTGTCKHGNPLIPGSNDHLFRCDFHMYDSVSIHLVLACLYNTLWAIDNSLSDNLIMMGSLLGLYHDIAKPLTVETYEFKSQKMPTITGFPAHAELGCMLFQAHWHPGMMSLITKNDYMTVATAILRHMCGYHGDENHSNQYKRDLLLLEQPDVKNLLCLNRVGDHFGKLTQKSDDDESADHFLEEQVLFEKRMTPTPVFDLPTVLRRNTNKFGAINPDKICLFVIGTSGAGKSFFIDIMNKLFARDTTVISRDECIAAVCADVHARLESADYVQMYKIYEAGKALSGFVRKSSGPKKLDKRELVEFENAKLALVDAQIAWNAYRQTSSNSAMFPEIKVYDLSTDPVPNISAQVQSLFEKEIYSAMGDPKAFIVIDTFMSCFPMAVESCVPQELSRYFRVHVHVQSYLERKTTSIAATVRDQLKVSGPYGLDNPLHPDGFKNGKNKKAFASLSAEIGTEGPLPRSTFTSRFRPHLVAGVCTRTADGGDLGYIETLNCLANLSRGLLKAPVSQGINQSLLESSFEAKDDLESDTATVVNSLSDLSIVEKAKTA